MNIVLHINEVPEEPHPFLKNVTMKTLLSKRDNNANTTCIVVRCPSGSEIEEHIHRDQDDLIYVLKGKATMWVEELGYIKLYPGTFVAVKHGKRHKTFAVEEDLIIFDTFTPPII
jgi:quercetin dioxygenase-like cupin family protein